MNDCLDLDDEFFNILVRMKKAEEKGVGIRLSNDDLLKLFIGPLGNVVFEEKDLK